MDERAGGENAKPPGPDVRDGPAGRHKGCNGEPIKVSENARARFLHLFLNVVDSTL